LIHNGAPALSIQAESLLCYLINGVLSVHPTNKIS